MMKKKTRLEKKIEKLETVADSPHEELTRDLEENLTLLSSLFGEKSDLVIRKIDFKDSLHCAVVYIESLTDKAVMDNFVIRDLNGILSNFQQEGLVFPLDANKINIATNKMDLVCSVKDIVNQLLSGNSVVLLDSHNNALIAGTQGYERRSVTEPSNESVVRGPREAFNESLQTNTGLIRTRLRTQKLKVEKLTVGKLTQTPVAMLYLEGIANPEIVEEVTKRLGKIQIDGVLESQYIEEFIEDPQSYTPFPTVFSTERPDRIVANLLEGRIAILLEGTPFALVVPATFSLFLISNEDYYQRYDIATFLRLLRVFSFGISMILPGFYVALLTFHQEMIPTPLLIALTGQREGVPLGIALEVALMEITFEILREAGIRLPKTIGAAVSIVGGLVLGTAAVEAGLVAQGTVIAVSLTAIASFSTPAFNMAISARLIRFVLLILGASLGAFGLMFGLIFMFIHLNTLRSFGVPYLSSLSPFHPNNWKDIFIRVPWWAMKNRPEEVAKIHERRPTAHKPDPSIQEEDPS
jgi:spore germination protein KA